MEFTSPLTFGSHVDILYGALALKLNALFRVNVWPFKVTWLNLPTAYMVPPH